MRILLESKKLVRWGQLILHWPWFHEATGVWSIENIRWARHQIPISSCDVAGSITFTYLQWSLFLRLTSFQTLAKILKEKSNQFKSVQQAVMIGSVLSPWIYPKLDGARQIYICGNFLVVLIGGFMMTTVHVCVSARPPEEYGCKKLMNLPSTWKHKFISP